MSRWLVAFWLSIMHPSVADSKICIDVQSFQTRIKYKRSAYHSLPQRLDRYSGASFSSTVLYSRPWRSLDNTAPRHLYPADHDILVLPTVTATTEVGGHGESNIVLGGLSTRRPSASSHSAFNGWHWGTDRGSHRPFSDALKHATTGTMNTTTTLVRDDHFFHHSHTL